MTRRDFVKGIVVGAAAAQAACETGGDTATLQNASSVSPPSSTTVGSSAPPGIQFTGIDDKVRLPGDGAPFRVTIDNRNSSEATHVEFDSPQVVFLETTADEHPKGLLPGDIEPPLIGKLPTVDVPAGQTATIDMVDSTGEVVRIGSTPGSGEEPRIDTCRFRVQASTKTKGANTDKLVESASFRIQFGDPNR